MCISSSPRQRSQIPS